MQQTQQTHREGRKITSEQLSEYKELYEKLKTLVKTVNQPIVYEIPDNNLRLEHNEGFVTRSRLVQTSIPMNSFSTELVELISRQYLNKDKKE